MKSWHATLVLCLLSACGGGGGGGSNNQGANPNPVSPPPTPRNVTATGKYESVEVSWSSSFSAASYNVYWSDSPDVSAQNGTRISTTDLSVVIQGLANGTTYYAVVNAENSGGASTSSSVVQAGAVAIAPSRVRNLALTPGDGVITMEWDGVSDAESYVVSWHTSSNGRGTESQNPGSPYVLSGLTNGVKYFVGVSGENSAGVGPGTGVLEATPTGSVAGWTPQTRISELTRAGGDNYYLLDADINDKGVAAVVWRSIGTRSWVTVNHTTGGDWHEPELVVESGLPAAVNVLPDDEIVLAYSDGDEVWLKHLTAGAWSDPVLVSDENNPRQFKGLVNIASDDSGNLFLAWVATVNTDGTYAGELDEVWARRYDRAAGTWEDAAMLSQSVRAAGFIAIETGEDNSAVVAWLQDTSAFDENEFNGGPRNRAVYASWFDGVSWHAGAPVGHADLVENDEVVELALDVNDAGSAAISYKLTRSRAGPNSRSDLVGAARFDADLGQWSGPEVVVDSVADKFSIDVVIDAAKGILAAWENFNYVATSDFDPASALWGDVEDHPTVDLTGSGSTLGMEQDSSGRTALVWTTDTLDTNGVFVRWLEPGSSTWSDVDHIGGYKDHWFQFELSDSGYGIVVNVVSVEIWGTNKFIVFANLYSP